MRMHLLCGRSLPKIAWRAVRSHNPRQSFDQALELVEREVVQVSGFGREGMVLDCCPWCFSVLKRW